MDNGIFNILLEYLNIVFLVFSAVLFVLYFLMAYLATRNSIHYKHKNSFGDISKTMGSPLSPGITIIAPAFNEGLTIVENVRSLLSLQYVNYEVMVVNDGSKDDTLQKLIEAYHLQRIDKDIDPEIKSKPIRGIYKSDPKILFKTYGGR